MNGIWLQAGQVSFRDDLPTPLAAEGEVLLQVERAGICGTDMAMLAGYADYIGVPGHEFVATALDGVYQGQRVVADINVGCGQCPRCHRDGNGHHCGERSVVGIRTKPGAFADQVAVPEANLVPVPASLPDELAVLAEPTAAALQVLETVDTARITSALVVGAGRLGTLVTWVLASAGVDVAVVARTAERIERLPPVRTNPAPGEQFDLVVECSGNPDALALALGATQPRGILTLKSTYPGLVPMDMSQLVVDEITLVGSRCGDMPAALGWLEAHGEKLELPQATFSLSRCQAAFSAAATSAFYKVCFVPQGGD